MSTRKRPRRLFPLLVLGLAILGPRAVAMEGPSSRRTIEPRQLSQAWMGAPRDGGPQGEQGAPFSPAIQTLERGQDVTLVPSPDLVELVRPMAEMNQYAYTRGQDPRYGHTVTSTDRFPGWSFKSFSAVRGLTAVRSLTGVAPEAEDPNAGFIAHNPETHRVVIVLRGSVNDADWGSNFCCAPVLIASVKGPNEDALNLPGKAHSGFLNKYLSSRKQILDRVDGLLLSLSPEERLQTQFYVTGHSQGGGLGQLLVGDLCQHLAGGQHYTDFVNSRDNRVHAWLLAAPLALDADAVEAVEQLVGKSNIVVQNIWADPVPNAMVPFQGSQLTRMGTGILQSSLTALARFDTFHREAIRRAFADGNWRKAIHGSVIVPWDMPSLIGAAMHMCSDNVNYRGVGTSCAFDPEMVDRTEAELKAGLEASRSHRQWKDETRQMMSELSSKFREYLYAAGVSLGLCQDTHLGLEAVPLGIPETHQQGDAPPEVVFHGGQGVLEDYFR